jgi:S1-C subfamily serine protease
MKCPKCHHEQVSDKVCESCGIYFEKYNLAQLRKGIVIKERKDSELLQQRNSSNKVFPALLVIAALGGLYALFIKDVEDTSITHVDNDSSTSPQTHFTEQPSNTLDSGIKGQLENTHAPRNAIETSRNATVFIETSWGSVGSGFIVSNNCHVITNKHVVNLDIDQVLESAKNDPKLNQKMLKKYAIERAEINQMSARHDIMVRIEGITPESEKLRKEIEQRKKFLSDLPGLVEERMEQAANELKWKDRTEGIKVSLIDNTSFTIHQMSYSENFDLAIFKLPAENCPFLELDGDNDIPQGTKLYTIGNPSGLGYSVTSGIFSGYREIDSKRFIQTDASINPGNSGGPLIKENGRAVGVNTLVMQGAQGIGFAVPVSIIKEEFGHLLITGNKSKEASAL